MSSSWTIKRRAKKAVNERIKQYRPAATASASEISDPPSECLKSQTEYSAFHLHAANVSTGSGSNNGESSSSTSNNTCQDLVEVTVAMEAEESEDDNLLELDEVGGDSSWSDSEFEMDQPAVGVEPTKLSSTYLVFLLANWANKHGSQMLHFLRYLLF